MSPRSSSSLSLNPGISSVTISIQTPACEQPGDGVEDWLQPSAQLAIAAIVEALEIDLVEIDVRTKILENALRAVAVRDEARHQTATTRLLEDVDCPLSGDQWLVVGRDDDLCAECDGVLGERGAADISRRRTGNRIA